ncbi:hypothetical protein DRH29_01635 [candidate division Kazan bacterium]|uniref:Uncharacterized protein n=1 Tax=candidate division Kazan bacterium TaxID=2202143 RepID=A0A420ZDA3_UNCK3|nr:MAG: hypothetical protein DRH29_01635 [candidate division Kazan bacterium]
MSKKHLKRLKELQRLQALHQDAERAVPEAVVRQPEESAQTETLVSPEAPVTPAAPVTPPVVHEYSYVKKDLIFLLILIVAIIVVLVALNWAIDNTAFGSWLVGLL